MVAGRRFRGEDEQGATQHQPSRRGELGVEAILEDRCRAGEEGCLRAGVEAGGPVDEEDDGGAQQAEDEDDPAQLRPPPAGRGQRQHGGQQPHGHQQVGVGVDRSLGVHGRRPGRLGQAGVAGAADLDAAVVDELGGQQTGGGGGDHAADRPLRGDRGARPGRGPHRPCREDLRASLEEAEKAQAEHPDRAQAPARPAQQAAGAAAPGLRPAQQPLRPALRAPPRPGPPAQDRRLGANEEAVDPAVDPARPAQRQLRQRSPTAAIRRCYYSASPSPLLLRGLPRAREGLFLAPIPVLAGRPLFSSSPLHDNPFTLRPCHAASH